MSGLDPDHPWILKTHASLLNEQALETPSAEIAIEQEKLIGKLRIKFGEESPLAATVVANRAATLYRLGDYDASEKGFSEAHALLLRSRGPEHLETLRIAINIVSALTSTRRPENLIRARGLAEEILEINFRNFGPLARISLTTQMRLAEVHMALGDWMEAVEVMSDPRTMDSHTGTSAPHLRAQLGILDRLFESSACISASRHEQGRCDAVADRRSRIEAVLTDAGLKVR